MNLFDESEVARCATAAILRNRAVMTFGAVPLAGRLGKPFRAALPETHRNMWENLIAAEALLARRSGLPFPTSPKPDSRPCGSDSPCYRELDDLPFGVTLFPLAANSGAPQTGRVWCFNVANTRKRLPQPANNLDGWIEFQHALPDRTSLRFFFDLPTDAPVAGRSWQLAARLAAAFSARNLGPQTRELATNWIATGAVDPDESVHPVKAGNKGRLHTNRRWFYPANTTGFQEVAGFAVARLEEARAHILNTPIPLPRDIWPARIRVLHMLVGGQLPPQQAAGLIPNTIERIELWHSASTTAQAGQLTSFFAHHIPGTQVMCHPLSANSLVAMQEAIAVRLAPDLEQAAEKDPVWFNVTSGNRLMFFAVFMLARQPRYYQKLRMIYRELGASAFDYIQISHSQAGPETRVLYPPPIFFGVPPAGNCRKPIEGAGKRQGQVLFLYRRQGKTSMNIVSVFPYYYVFTAKGIQEFILKGDKLRLMIGASGLIEQLPNAFLNRLLAGLTLKENVDYRILSRSAGGARILFKDRQSADEVARILPLAVDLYAPGLELVQSIVPLSGGLNSTMAKAEQDMRARRNLPLPLLPPPGPLVDRCPRSGQPVAGWFRQQNEKEPADSAMLAKDHAFRDAKATLSSKILPAACTQVEIPDSFASFCKGEKGYLAIIHIDGNGLGQKVFEILQDELTDEDAANKYTAFSSLIENTTKTAAQDALAERAAENGDRTLFVVPLICAGDDLTLIMKAQDAIPFARAYLQKLEGQSRAANAQMTACAGILFVKPSYPFAQAYGLCASLCKFAKNETKRSGSAIAFWRLTSSLSEDFDSIRKQELTTADSLLTMMPYMAGEQPAGSPHPSLANLLDLKEQAAKLPRGSLRGILSFLYESREKTVQAYERMLQVARQKHDGDDKKENSVNNFVSVLRRNTGDALFTRGTPPATPLHDALELIAVERE